MATAPVATPARDPEARPGPPAAVSAASALLGKARATGVVLGPSFLLDLGAATGVALAGRALARRPRSRADRSLRPLAALGLAAPAIYLLTVRPWLLNWGATPAERSQLLPGDEQAPEPGFHHTRAVTIHAPVEVVWPWLAQIGQDRGGFYSHAWLENLAGCGLRNADRVHPEWQQRAVGDMVPLHPDFSLKVTVFEPDRALGLEGWGTFVLEPVDARTTRLLVRESTPHGWGAVASALLWEVPHFIMERQMLLGIKARAERTMAPD